MNREDIAKIRVDDLLTATVKAARLAPNGIYVSNASLTFGETILLSADNIISVVLRPLEIKDRAVIRGGSVKGTIQGIYDRAAWVLWDQCSQPATYLLDELEQIR